MHYVKAVKYLENYRLQLKFEDGSLKVVDLKNHLDGKIFEPLKDIEYFKKVKVNEDVDTICWDNGADLAPEFLYQIGTSTDTVLSLAK